MFETPSIGFATLGRDFAISADCLVDASDEGKLDLRHDSTADFLYAHSFELLLKGCIL